MNKLIDEKNKRGTYFYCSKTQKRKKNVFAAYFFIMIKEMGSSIEIKKMFNI